LARWPRRTLRLRIRKCNQQTSPGWFAPARPQATAFLLVGGHSSAIAQATDPQIGTYLDEKLVIASAELIWQTFSRQILGTVVDDAVVLRAVVAAQLPEPAVSAPVSAPVSVSLAEHERGKRASV
jgi:hypothetical protein